MSDFLETVARERRAYVAAARAWKPLAKVRFAAERAAIRRERPRFAQALRARREAGALAVIAEVKRHSPALGVLAAVEQPGSLAVAYADGGAAAISVITEPQHWGGSLDDLRAVRSAEGGVGWRFPLLAKDVIVDEYQIAEAGAAGADAVLLIAEALTADELAHLIGAARQLMLDVLLEAHDAAAFARGVEAVERTRHSEFMPGSIAIGTETLLGVNARDLRYPAHMDRSSIHHLAPSVPNGVLLVAESGITSVEDAEALPRRVDAVLVGTALVRAADPAPLVRALAAARPGRALA
jgi:indole-3-glycerol phosphate synthase